MRAFLITLTMLPVTALAEESGDAVNMLWIATAAALVFLMQAGFALLESGMSRAKKLS